MATDPEGDAELRVLVYFVSFFLKSSDSEFTQ